MVTFDVKLSRFRDAETGELVSGRAFRNIFHAAATIAKHAKKSIKTAPGPSSAGQPPRTRRGLLRRSIRYRADKQKQEAVIGPRYSIVGEVGAVHEFGGAYKGETYPARPYMKPALERNLHRLGGEFTGESIGG